MNSHSFEWQNNWWRKRCHVIITQNSPKNSSYIIQPKNNKYKHDIKANEKYEYEQNEEDY